MFPAKPALSSDGKSKKGPNPKTPGEQVPPCCQVPIVTPSSDVGLQGPNRRSRPSHPRVCGGGDLRSRSVDNQQRDWNVPVRATYINRPNCDTITSNYEEAFGPVKSSLSKGPSAPMGELPSGTPSKHVHSAPGNFITPTFRQSAEYNLVAGYKTPISINSQSTEGKSAGDMIVPANPGVAESTAHSRSKRRSTSNQTEIDFDAPAASKVRILATTSPSLLSTQPKLRGGINVSIPQPLLTILASSGLESQKFVVHKSVGMQSRLIRHAFTKFCQLDNHTEQTLTVPDIEGLIVGLLVNWLYTQKIELAEDRSLQLVEVAKLWTAAGFFFLPLLQNKALRLLVMMFGDSDSDKALLPTDEEVKKFCQHAYEIIGKTPLKRLAVDQMAEKISAANVDMWLNTLPKDMQEDLTKALVTKLDMTPENRSEGKHIFQYFVPEIEINEDNL